MVPAPFFSLNLLDWRGCSPGRLAALEMEILAFPEDHVVDLSEIVGDGVVVGRDHVFLWQLRRHCGGDLWSAVCFTPNVSHVFTSHVA